MMRPVAKEIYRMGSAVIGLFCLCYAVAAHTEPNLREGLWEITIRMEMAGKPGDPFPPTTRILCLKDNNKLPELLQQDQACRITDTKTQGNQASWKMKCLSQESRITGSGSITYKGERFDGIIHVRVQRADAEPVKLTQHIEGRRNGECP